MSVELRRLIDLEESLQPDPVTVAFRGLCTTLGSADQPGTWNHVLKTNALQTRGWITTGILHGFNAVGALFVDHALSAAYSTLGREAGLRILGFVFQLSLSEAEWSQNLEAFAADGVAFEADRGVLRLGRFPDTVLAYLARRGNREILRELFLGSSRTIEGVARAAMRDAPDFDTWTEDLSILAAHLAMRRWLRLRVDGQDRSEVERESQPATAVDDAHSGGRFSMPPQDENPLLTQLIERAEIDELHRKEAFAAECFAHLFSAVLCGCVTADYQQSTAEEYVRRATANRLDARQWLALGKSRFQLAPYL